MATCITIDSMFHLWRILVGPLCYPALVSHHYLLRALLVSYLSLATAAGLIQLGLLVSFERVVAVQEGLVMAGVAAGCVIITVAHLLLEAATRQRMELLHIGRNQDYVWLSGGNIDPFISNSKGTSFLLYPHILLLCLTNLAMSGCKLWDRLPRYRQLVTRYRFHLVTSGANGRLNCSAYTVLFLLLLGILVINPLYQLPQSGKPGDRLPLESVTLSLVAFWLGCGSFLLDPEPRQFVLRRWSRAWARWREYLPQVGPGAGGGARRVGVVTGRGPGQTAEWPTPGSSGTGQTAERTGGRSSSGLPGRSHRQTWRQARPAGTTLNELQIPTRDNSMPNVDT